MVAYWAYPTSGFDLAKKNTLMQQFKTIMLKVHEEDPNIKEGLDAFEDKHSEKVLHFYLIESDTKLTNPKIDVYPVIHEQHSEAEIATVKDVTAMFQTSDDHYPHYINEKHPNE
jgi:hypothetical protein